MGSEMCIRDSMNGLQMFLGDSFYENYLRVLLYQGGFFKEITALKMFFNSFIMATGVAILSVVTSLMAAYALVYYRIKHETFLFWIIFITIFQFRYIEGKIHYN